MTSISINNGLSQLHAPKDLIQQLQPLIAIQEIDLPPRDVQYWLKHWVGRIKQEGGQRYGYDFDLQRFLGAWEGQKAIELGWGEDEWSGRVFEDVLKRPGIWDGWRSLIPTHGEFGTGLVPHVERALTLRLGQPPPQKIDQRVQPKIDPRPLTIPLWKHQEEAVQAWLRGGFRGVLDLPPRSGKTRIAAAIIQILGVPRTVVVTPRVTLVEQTGDVLEGFFPGHVVKLTGGNSKASHRRKLEMLMRPIWVTTPQTALKLDLSTRQMLIIDEFHHSGADSYQKISVDARNAYFRLGMTGTHFRADNRTLLMHSVLERAVYSRTVGEMVTAGILAPAKACMIRTTGETTNRRKRVPDLTYRNELIVAATKHLMAAKRRTLVLAVEVRHVVDLAAKIGTVGVDGRDNSAVRPALDHLAATPGGCVVGTSVIGEGIDVPVADALVYAAGSSSKVKVMQDVFRVLTGSAGKDSGLIVDFADNHDETEDGGGIYRAANRLHYYRSSGFDVEVLHPSEFPNWLARCV